MTRTAAPSVLDLTASDLLRAELADRPALRALEPVSYAAGHALFEARSDQRALLTAWLARHLGPRSAGPSAVLSVGCGDGTVDAVLATALAAGGAPVDYLGVEPHAPSAHEFIGRLRALDGVSASVVGEPFGPSTVAGRRDVVVAVHSLYYVEELAASLARAVGLLAPGGELLVLHAPREPLNAFVRLLAPGAPQGFSADVLAALHAQGRQPVVERLDAVLDLSPTGDVESDRLMLDFTVQAQVPADLRELVLAALAEVALPGPGLVLPHPVDAIVVTA